VDGSVFTPEYESGVAGYSEYSTTANTSTLLGRVTARWRAGVGVRF